MVICNCDLHGAIITGASINPDYRCLHRGRSVFRIRGQPVDIVLTDAVSNVNHDRTYAQFTVCCFSNANQCAIFQNQTHVIGMNGNVDHSATVIGSIVIVHQN